MSAAVRRSWLARLTGLAALILIGATGPLWLPPTPQSFPQLPLFGLLIPAPAWCDWAALAGILLGAAGMLGGSSKAQEIKNQNDPGANAAHRSRPSLVLEVLVLKLLPAAPALFTASLAFALALNQIRIQVWAYQFLLLGAVLSLCPRTATGDRAAVSLARVLAVGILFHSGLSKLDLAFAEGPGTWLIGGFLGLFGVDAEGFDPKLISAAAFAAPAWELALSVLLAVPGLRRVGLVAAAFMHLSVTATLWNLDQSWGVLLWNGFFLAHEFILFWPEPRGDRVPLWATVRSAGPRSAPAALFIAAAVLLPFGTRSGYWDVWPGWAVYAGGVPKAWVGVLDQEIPTPANPAPPRKVWPGEFAPLIDLVISTSNKEPDPLEKFEGSLQIMRRSGQMVMNDRGYEAEALDELGVPLPQGGRAAAGVLLAESIRRSAAGGVWHAGTVDVKAVPSRWQRSRNRETLFSVFVRDGRLDPAGEPPPFWLNARPRALSLPPEAR